MCGGPKKICTDKDKDLVTASAAIKCYVLSIGTWNDVNADLIGINLTRTS